ncbi:MAG TPA: DUF2262 domain-containing protein [Sphingomicrobium sp.]|nr:DUF2262 domain-containing protein [Sphingomicrobium sp.]
MGRRVRVRGIVKGGAGFAQSRRPDGEWDLWRVGVSLRPWRLEGGPIETSTISLRRHTRLPFWLWQLLFLKNTTVELLAELDDDIAKGARLIAWLGPRRDPALRNAHAEWFGQRTLEHSAFGRFTFDERLDWFETKADWLGCRVSLSLGMDAEGRGDAETAARLFQQASEWDSRARDLAADELLSVKNDNWLGDDERPLSREEFKARMTLESISINPGPFIQFFFGDGDLFAGHTIIVTFDEEEGEAWAEFAG